MNAKEENKKNNGYILQPIGVFHTYETIEELQEYVESFSNEQKALAHLILSLTWNTCAHLTKGE